MGTITGNWGFPTSMRFGPGRISELPAVCRELGISRPILITDEGLRDLPMVRDAVAALNDAGLPCALFTDVRGNPVNANVDAGIVAYREHDSDGVIAFGGGSGMDVAKAVALMLGQDRPIWDFEDVGDNWKRVNAKVIPPIVAVPTTSGTGSEVGRASVITNEETHVKKIIFHPKMLPSIVISDPELTVGLPPSITAGTGMDAFIHCFEAFCAPGYHPMADGIALEGMRRISIALPRAYDDGKDIEARADMLAAASMGATAFQKGLGGIHALSHSIGVMYNTHHGRTNAVVMPYIMRRNEQAIGDHMELLGRVLGLPNPSFPGVLDWVLDFRTRVGIEHSAADLGVPGDQADLMGTMAEVDPPAASNPIALSAADYTAVFRKALEGTV
ncbi:MAG: iron-containing alcohol dehydrogenase [Alphaproteobacteria bacterium]